MAFSCKTRPHEKPTFARKSHYERKTILQSVTTTLQKDFIRHHEEADASTKNKTKCSYSAFRFTMCFFLHLDVYKAWIQANAIEHGGRVEHTLVTEVGFLLQVAVVCACAMCANIP